MGDTTEEGVLMTAQSATAQRAVAPADLAYVAVFAALIAALSLAPAFAIGPVPITLQTFGVALAALCLGPWRGLAAVALFVGVGVAGLPVFAGGRAGVSVLLGPTGGYVASFLVSAFLMGLAARIIVRRRKRLAALWLFLATVVVRLVAVWPLGAAGLVFGGGMGWREAFALDLTFWPGDLLKNLVAVLVAVAVHKAFPRLLGR